MPINVGVGIRNLGVPETYQERTVVIKQPVKKASQSGVNFTNMWEIEFKHRGESWHNPLMGWPSTRDPTTCFARDTRLFPTKEAAIVWCESKGFKYELEKSRVSTRREKSYSKNFDVGHVVPPPSRKDVTVDVEPVVIEEKTVAVDEEVVEEKKE